jgi:CspA family cold shock protein
MRLLLPLCAAVIAALLATFLVIRLELQEQPVLLAALLILACCIGPLLGARRETNAPEATPTESRETGEVKWFNGSKGFGFIRRENGEEIFVHFRSIRGSNQHRRQLREGQKVSFVVGQSDKGPQAEQVEALPH